MATGEFDINQWAESFELSTETVQALAQKGFSTRRTLSKLTNDVLKASEFKKLPLAQFLLLQEACDSLNNAGTAAATNPQVGGSSGASLTGAQLTAQDVAAFIATGNSVLSEEGKYGKPNLFDPFQFELNDNNAKCPYRDIRDYISLVPKTTGPDSGPASVQIGSQEFLLKDCKIPWELLNVAQYMEGSLKIMREMALQDKCKMGELLEYANYLVKIATLGQCFHWPSVLKYDQAYRKAQAASGFSWGADNAYLMQLYLKPDKPQYAPQSKKPPQVKGKKGKFDPETGTQICLKWNSQNGCNFRGCKFAHKCMSCYSQAHPQHQHTPSIQTTEAENS